MDTRPLAEKLRPQKLNDIIGQDKLTGDNGIISKLLHAAHEKGTNFPSLILWGPPGCGKTTLARVIANELETSFFEFSAVNASVKDIEKVIHDKEAKITSQKALNLNFNGSVEIKNKNKRAPLIFLDEIHRFNKSQQDSLLPHVEKGTITLIGATTENPSFEVISPLLSRCRVIVLNRLDSESINKIIIIGAKELNVDIEPKTLDFLSEAANGDARVALNILEISHQLSDGDMIMQQDVAQSLQKRQLNFDLQGEEFYNTISALHKSIRGSDPDAALYWLARMLEAGQDPIYIARRLVRCASEDIGIYDPQALPLAVAAFNACEKLGMPECNLALAEIVVYLAKAPKSNALYLAYGEAKDDVETYGNLPVPMHIRNAPTKLMKQLGYGKDYNYHHSPKGEKLEDIDYLPEEIKDRKYFTSKHN